MSAGRLLETVGAIILTSIPLGISVWAFLDAAHRPEWPWALAGRRRMVWMPAILCGTMTVLGGLLISGYYLLVVRRELVWAESGRITD